MLVGVRSLGSIGEIELTGHGQQNPSKIAGFFFRLIQTTGSGFAGGILKTRHASLIFQL